MPDKTIYVGLNVLPDKQTASTSARFALWPENSPGNNWPHDTVIVAQLDGNAPETRVFNKPDDMFGVFDYDNLAVGDHVWVARITGTNIYSGDSDPGFDYSWTIVA